MCNFLGYMMETVMKGCLAYEDIWAVAVEKSLLRQNEHGNIHDYYTITITVNGGTCMSAGH